MKKKASPKKQKKLSRQVQWQQKRRELGLCVLCGCRAERRTGRKLLLPSGRNPFYSRCRNHRAATLVR